MAGVNKVIILGNLGADPEVRTTTSGIKVARLRLATSESYTNKEGQRITNTEWHTVNLWRGLADIAEKYLAKGRQVYVEGKLRTRSYDDKDGITRYSTEIEADNINLIGGSKNDDEQGNGGSGGGYSAPQQQQQSKPQQQPSAAAPSATDDDDLPF
ncbi:MAG: single-stranded DNA-binding protein [Salibacteraceae bacterium]|jgi:single-strand DNA-binding protein|nr:single-stranded DNA-binding protein [Salibacteraceae bacterium]MDP4686180.1 single-stranded DNA-binding protein [Salibacteraceae bacterium]MDP4763034.1 single-stranded DNA-binding protein [Salibacteraceae bacterium]MDP4934273.1 single-stranded DNA-binding protein [Salibacteraceae bacterium]MDP4963481.1 single-stranded DNA-binding protein [Salibacteraceae bacterium]